MPELTQNLWERYGFSANPFDTRALSLSEGAALSVSQAYVPRGRNSEAASILTNFFRNPGGGRIAVEGEPGIGKTTFVNFHRHQWETGARDKLLTPATEISLQGDWDAKAFLLNLLGALSARLQLTLGEKAFERDETLREIKAVSGVTISGGGGFSVGGQVVGTGGHVARSATRTVQVGNLTGQHLRRYLGRLVDTARTRAKAAGVTFHFNNLELMTWQGPARLRAFFEQIRDILQEPDVYFVFVGYPGMFQQVIASSERVRSIFFDTPVHLDPLSPAQVREIIETRYKLLALPGKKWIRPVENPVIEHLYQTFAGKIRYVMNAVTTLVNRLPESYAQPLDLDGAVSILSAILTGELKKTLTSEGVKVFLAAVEQGRFTNASLARQTGKTKQAINKYLAKFTEFEYIHPAEKVGRSHFYQSDPRFAILSAGRVR